MNLEYHSKAENCRLTGHKEHCEYLDQECYHDGSGMAADAAWRKMQESGTAGLWKELEEFYHDNVKDPHWVECVPGADGLCRIPAEYHWGSRWPWREKD